MLEFEKALAFAKKDLNDPKLQVELNYKLGTVLHWIMAYWERVKKSNKKLPEEGYLSSMLSALQIIK